jgi:hypothetical protein
MHSLRPPALPVYEANMLVNDARFGCGLGTSCLSTKAVDVLMLLDLTSLENGVLGGRRYDGPCGRSLKTEVAL